MKKKLFISLLLVLILCTSLALAACKSVDPEVLDRMLADLIDTYPATAITNESYNLSTVKIDFDDNGKMTEVKIVWTIEGSTEVTISDVDEENVTVNIPTTRDSEIKYTLVGSLADAKGNVYTNKDGEAYTARFSRTAQKTNASQVVGAQFRETIVMNPVADTAYVWGTYRGHELYYFAGTTGSNTHNYATTKNYSEAVPVKLEATEGGYYLYFEKDGAKQYINMTIYDNGSYVSGSTGLVAEADKANLDGVLTIDANTGALKCDTLNYKNNTYKFYFGIRFQYAGEVRAIDANYLTYDENENHSWKTNETPMYLLSKETVLPAQPTLTEAQILEQAFALGANEEMAGVLELTGVITEVVNTYDQYGTVKIQVADKVIECYGLLNNKDLKVSALNVGDKIKVRGVLRNYTKDTTNKVEFDQGCTFTMIEAAQVEGPTRPEDLVHAGTAADPFSVADADKYAKVLGSKKTEDVVYVTGIVADLEPVSNGEYKFNIVDAAGDTVKCIIYYTTSTQAPANGDTVVVKGYLTQYKGSAEIIKKDNDNKPAIVSINGTELGAEAPIDETTILGQIKLAAVSAPTAEGSYKLVMWQGTLQKPLYANGAMSGSYLATTQDPSAAAAVTVEEATNGFYLALTVDGTKKYVTVTPRASDATKADISLADTATTVLTVNENGLLVSGDFVLGTYNNFNTISVSNISYFSSTSVIDNSQFVVRIIPADTTLNIPEGTIKEADSNEHVTVAITEPTPVEGVVTAKWYTTVKFTVTPESGYAIVSVKVNNKSLTAKTGNEYEVELIGDMEITVDVKDATASRDNYTVTFAKADMADHGSSGYTGSWTHTSDELEITLEAWNGNKSNGGWAYIRAGRNGYASTAKITATITEKVSSITITVDTYNSSKGKATVYLLVSDSDDFTNATRVELTGTFAAGEVTFNIPEAAANMHYQIVVDCASGSANGFVQISKIVYNFEAAE